MDDKDYVRLFAKYADQFIDGTIDRIGFTARHGLLEMGLEWEKMCPADQAEALEVTRLVFEDDANSEG